MQVLPHCVPLCTDEETEEKKANKLAWPPASPSQLTALLPVSTIFSSLFIQKTEEGLGSLVEDGPADPISIGHFFFLQWP